MRSTKTRLARVERSLSYAMEAQAAGALQAKTADWRAAGAPISFVCGDTEAEAQQREATLRDLGLIHPLDRIVHMPMQSGCPKPFLRHYLLEDRGPAKRHAIKAALATPSVEYPAAWYTQPSQGGPT